MDNPGTPETPAPTHWNTRRDPAWSFQCPFCGSKVRIEELYGGEEALGPGNTHAAMCMTCPIAIPRNEWQYLKAMELLQE